MGNKWLKCAANESESNPNSSKMAPKMASKWAEISPISLIELRKDSNRPYMSRNMLKNGFKKGSTWAEIGTN